MTSLSEMPMVERAVMDEATSAQNTKRYQFIPTQSIAANFGNMIAQTDRKPSKPHKIKKKRSTDYASIYSHMSSKSKVWLPHGNQPRDAIHLAHSSHALPHPTALQRPTNLPLVQQPQPISYHSQTHFGPGHTLVQLEREPGLYDDSEEMDLSSGSDAEVTLGQYPEEDAVSSKMSTRDSLRVPEVSERRKGFETPDLMDLSSGPEADEEVEDLSSVSQRVSSTPFNESAASSHTSAMMSNDANTTVRGGGPPSSKDRAISPGSDLSSQLTPPDSLTPASLKVIKKDTKSAPQSKQPRNKRVNFPEPAHQASKFEGMTRDKVAQQAIHAAKASRLYPFKLHPQEYHLLRDHICKAYVTAYLNIRNRILRLWVRNPLVQVTEEEAIGCVQSSRWTGIAKVAYEWLVRKGYINFGCLEISPPHEAKSRKNKNKKGKKKTIAVVGAGMAGLGCARQLEGLVQHYQDKWTAAGEDPPQIILLEGRNRIGGRVYSHPLKNQNAVGIPPSKRCTAEMGAHIIVGFEEGNPLNMIVRGQLALHHHTLKNITEIHDTDGELVDDDRDRMIEALHNDILDRAGQYRIRLPDPATVEGDEGMIQLGRDPHQKGGPSISQEEINKPNLPSATHNKETESVPGGIDKLTGKAHMVTGSRRKKRPAVVAEEIGWQLGNDMLSYEDLNLDAVAKDTAHPTLGAVMDEAVKQYQFLLDLTPSDLRLMNWHHANLEYANGSNLGKLSLGGWDLDTGNEFSGGHAQVIGGYQQVPRGLLQSPSKLDLRTHKIVKQVEYNIWSGNSKTPGARIQCEDGENIEADYVVLTSSLGVLKSQNIKFMPPLPDWKTGTINRLGFGLLNKCILVYKEPFWNVEQDMFGLLREPETKDSVDQEDYSARRGRFYFFWNCVKTSGRPVLVALLAGDAAFQVEETSDAVLVAEATQELAKIFKDRQVPLPEEAIVTRWGQDRFAYGTYSFVGPESIPGDYDTMAARVGNLYFAGEATCATHPATVHGAYLSGLRAASEIIEDLLGPIDIPSPLVSWPATARSDATPQETPSKKPPTPASRTSETATTPVETLEERKTRLDRFEVEIMRAIHETLGPQPLLPKNARSNAYLLYCSETAQEVKESMKDLPHKTDSLRKEQGARWNALPEEVRQVWKTKANSIKAASQLDMLTFQAREKDWNFKAIEVRRQYINEHPGVLTAQEEKDMWKALEGSWDSSGRKAKRASGYADVKEEDVSIFGGDAR